MTSPLRRWSTLAALALVVVLACIAERPGRVAADPVTAQQLAASLLSSDDVPAYAITEESAPEVKGEVYSLAYHRLLSATNKDATGYATLDLTVQLLASAVPSQLVQAYLTSGKGFDAFNKQPGFRATGHLGVGNADDSAYFLYALPNTNLQYAVYLDVFMRGRLVVTVRYGALAGKDDPQALLAFAGQQDNKLSTSAALPAAILNPLATPTTLVSHRWYTSQNPVATLYYCDDDPAWKELSLDTLDSYGTVADLLVQYPGRTLNRPCTDGSTGP